MHPKRELIAALLLGLVFICCMIFMFIDVISRQVVSSIFLWGIPSGILFGIGTCMYLSKAWDPVNLRPTSSKTRKADLRLLWIVIPGGVVLSELLPPLLGEEITSLIISCVGSWFILTLGYVVVKVGWHHLR